jgi:hypothetical protein
VSGRNISITRDQTVYPSNFSWLCRSCENHDLHHGLLGVGPIFSGYSSANRLLTCVRFPPTCVHVGKRLSREAGGVFGGEGGSRTRHDPVDSVSRRFYNADVAVNASNAVAPCPLLPAGRKVTAARRFLTSSPLGGSESCRRSTTSSW